MAYKAPEQTPIVVVYTKGAGRKVYMKVFTNLKYVDPIISPRSNKLPKNAVILDIGQGACFVEKYKLKHKL
jgi:hypothetical protein